MTARAAAIACAACLAGVACGKSRAPVDAGPPAPLPEAPAPPGPGKARGALADADAATRAFRDAWREEVSVTPAGFSSRAKRFDRAVFRDEAPRAERKECETARRMASATPAAEPGGESLLLFGKLSALARPGGCWEIRAAELVGSEVVAYLDAQTGALVVAFVAPEG